MVESVVSLAIQKLDEFLSQKVVILQNVGNNVEWLKNELDVMRSFLKDAEEKQESDHRIQQWISEITNISYDTMSILEDFTLKIEETDDKKLGFLDRLHICACICRKQVDKYNIGLEIESIRERVLTFIAKEKHMASQILVAMVMAVLIPTRTVD